MRFNQCPIITTYVSDLIFCLQASSTKTIIHGYLLNSHIFIRYKTDKEFCHLQSTTVSTHRKKQNLSILLVHIHPDCDMAISNKFCHAITHSGLVVTPIDTYFTNFGDSVADSATF